MLFRNRIRFLPNKFVLLLLPLIFSPSFLVSQVVRGPYLQSGGTTHMTIRWRTDLTTDAMVWYGNSPTNLTQSISQSNLGKDHEVKITGLLPNTQYYYEIGDGGGSFVGGDSDHFFFTHPEAGYNDKIRLWILGDSGTKNKNARDVRDAYYNFIGPDFTDLILMLGDNAYSTGTDAEYQDAIFNNMYEDIIVQTPIWPTPGNHDTKAYGGNGSSAPYFDIFTLPTSGESGGLASGTEHYYSMDYGDLHVISLNSQNQGLDVGDPMLVWLENDLAATTQKWIFVIFHHPPYSKGSHDSDKGGKQILIRENINPILEDYGVDLVMSGHSHAYERSFLINGHYDVSSTLTSSMLLDDGDGREFGDGSYQKDVTGSNAGKGAVYVVAGSAGKISAAPLGHPVHYYDAVELGSVFLEIKNNRLDLKFIDATGNIDDYFTIIKEDVGGTPPSVTLTSPSQGQSYTAIQPITITANASDADGAVSQVEFFANGTSIGNDSSDPYSKSWTPSAGGNYTLTATATDNDGKTASSSVSISVNVSGTNVPPTVNITNPTNGVAYTGLQAISVDASANDSDGNVTNVEFFVDGVSIGNDGSAPYSQSWTPSAVGNYSLTAEATDNDGSSTTSSPVSVTFNSSGGGGGGTNFSTSSQISSNSDDAEENNSTGSVAVNSSDLDIINDGGTKDQTVGLRFTGLNIPAGATITNAYIQFTSDEVRTGPASLIIHGEDVDDALTFNNSSNNITSRSLTSASASWSPAGWQNVGDSGLDQQTSDLSAVLQEIVNRPGYVASNSVAFIISGSGRRAADSYNSSPSAAAILFVDYSTGGSGPTNLAPTVNISHPIDGSTYTNFQLFSIEATANDSDGNVSNVEFFVDGVSIGTDNSVPYSQDWNPSSNGTYTLSATATDDQGATASASSTITMNVPNTPPSVFITSPLGGSSYTSFQPISIGVNANDVGGTVSQVAFFVDGNAIGTDNSFPYSMSWTPSANGSHVLSATAMDNDGATASSSISISVNVAGTNIPPTVNITNPTNGATYTGLQAISVDASANDSDGNVTNVEFFVDGISIGNDGSAPFSLSWTPSAVGNYLLIAEATDNDGSSTTSSPVSVTFNSSGGGGGGTNFSTSSQISSNSDDAEETNSTGSVAVNSSDLDIINDGGTKDQTVGLRFTDLNIPAGATITNAYIQFTSDEVRTGPASLIIHGEDVDDALTFNNSSNNISSRSLTSASASWSPAGWQNVGDSGLDQQTSDLSAVLQEIVNRPGYIASNSVAFIISGSGRRAADSYNSSPSNAATLFVDYSTGSVPTNQVPTISITDPTNGATYTGLQAISVDAVANDSDGNVTNVEFFVDGVSIGHNNSAPYSQSWTPSIVGNYTLTAEATDNDGSSTISSAVSVSFINSSSQTTVSFQISEGDDDAEEHQNGAVKLGNSDLELVYDGGSKGNQTVGLRFRQVSIPAGAIISNAYVQFSVDEAKNVPGIKTIYGEAADDAALFQSTSFDLSSRPSTSATVSWDPPLWNTIGEAGPDQQTSDISSVIQEIIDRPGWNANQSLVVLFQGTGTRGAVSFNGLQSGAATLVVSYSGGGSSRFAQMETSFSTEMSVFPNPFEDRINIQLTFSDQETKVIEISLTDLVGRTIKSNSQTLSSGGIVKQDLSELADGMYLIKIEVEGQIFYQKIKKMTNK